LQGEELTTTAKRRSIDTWRLVKLVKGDLDWIVMKCLEKDRTRRYETANGLAMELRRYLHNEPIIARPPSRLYRFRKLARRNKLTFAAASITAMALLVGIVVSTWQTVRARRAEVRADQERDAALLARQRTEEINRFLTEDLLYQAAPDQSYRGSEMTVRQLLELAVKQLDEKQIRARDPQLEATLRLALGDTYHRLALLPEADRQIRLAVEIRRRELGSNHWDTLLAQLSLIQLEAGSMNNFSDQIERLSLDTLSAMRQAIEGQDSSLSQTNTQYRLMLDAESVYLWVLANRGEATRAAQLKRKNVANYERALSPYARDTITELGNLALILIRSREYVDAEQTAQETVRRFEHVGLADSESAFLTIAVQAEARFFNGDAAGAQAVAAGALPQAIKVHGPTFHSTLRIQSYLARSLAEQGQLEKAEPLARDTMVQRHATLPTNHVNTAISTLILGRILVKLGRPDEAQPLLESARSCFRKNPVSLAELAAECEIWLGAIQLAQGNTSAAEGLMLPGANYYLGSSALLSKKEQCDSIKHLVQLFTALNKPEQAANWQRRLDQAEKPSAGENNKPSDQSTRSND
jgi:hypothetical protein